MKDRFEDPGETDGLSGRRVRRFGSGAAVDTIRHQPWIVFRGRVVADELRRGGDDRQGAAVTKWKQPAEVVDDFVGIQPDCLRVIAHERACVQTGRPPREVAGLETLPQLDVDVGAGDDDVQRDAAPLTLAPQPRSERVAFRHDDFRPNAIPAPRDQGRLCSPYLKRGPGHATVL